MIYKIYGRTGHKVSAVGFGGMRFDTTSSVRDNAQLVRYAMDKGINFFDTAPGYCHGQSEDILGEAVSQVQGKRSDMYISTKAMAEKPESSQKAIQAVEQSLKRLKTDYIDFYHIWCIGRMDEQTLSDKPDGQYEGLLQCQEQGKIRQIAVSTHLRGPEVKEILQQQKFEGVLLGVNILNFLYRWEAVQYAHENGLGVVAMNPLAGGIIPQQEQTFAFLAGENETPTEAALRFCISCPQITVTLNGFTTHEHIDTACRVAESSKPYNEEDIRRIRRYVSNQMDKLCTGCGYCMNKCPKDIPVSAYMQYYNDKLILKKTDREMVDLLNHHLKWGILADSQVKASDCVRCGRCEMACTQHLDIVNRLDRISQWQ